MPLVHAAGPCEPEDGAFADPHHGEVARTGLPGEVILEETLLHAPRGDLDLPKAEPLHEGLEDDRAGDDDIGPVGVDPGNSPPFPEGHPRQQVDEGWVGSSASSRTRSLNWSQRLAVEEEARVVKGDPAVRSLTFSTSHPVESPVRAVASPRRGSPYISVNPAWNKKLVPVFRAPWTLYPLARSPATAAAIATEPTRIVGSGGGAKRLLWR